MSNLSHIAPLPPWQIHTIAPELPYLEESAAGVVGELAPSAPRDESILVQIYDECIPAQVFGSISCECTAILIKSREQIVAAGLGVLFSLKGGLIHPNQNYFYGQNHSPYSVTRYIPCARFLIANGVDRVRLMNPDPTKRSAFHDQGISFD